MSFKPAEKGKLIVHFENYVGNKKMSLDTVTYENALGQKFTVSSFKYYISNISLDLGNTKKEIQQTDSYLIKQDDEGTWIAELDGLPDGNYRSISFVIGVDSIHNCNGAQSGALDPINGMFWTWNTGYIFMKLEGKSPSSKQPGHIFEYHIGGYKEPANFIRTATLDFDKEQLSIRDSKTSSIYIKADAAEVLEGRNTIDFSKLSSVTDAHNADKVADNYAGMFSIIRIVNEK